MFDKFIILKPNFIHRQHNSLKNKAESRAELRYEMLSYCSMWKSYYFEFSTLHIKWLREYSKNYSMRSMASLI